MTTQKGRKLNDHVTRFHLDNGLFIDHETVTALQYRSHPYEIWESGAGETVTCRDGSTYQIAAYRGGANTLRAAIKQAKEGAA